MFTVRTPKKAYRVTPPTKDQYIDWLVHCALRGVRESNFLPAAIRDAAKSLAKVEEK